MDKIFFALQHSALGTAISESNWFPTIECGHVLCLTIVVGSILMVDFRLLNLASRNRPVSEVIADTLPWTWAAFIGAAITGLLLFTSAAGRYVNVWQFDTKMCVLVLAAINMLAFHKGAAYKNMAAWDRAPAEPPAAAKLAGALSILCWVTVITLGRWIGFV